ncbi:MAG: hypothetical protein RR808_07965 [Akkermansia sp.]
MKKTLFLTGALLLSLASLAQAKGTYTWTGEVSSEWDNQANWALSDGATWEKGGPTFGTDLDSDEDKVILDGAKTNKHSANQSMGYNAGMQMASDLTLTNGSNFQLNIQNEKGNATLSFGSSFTVDKSSKLTLHVQDADRYLLNNQGHDKDWIFNVQGYQGISMTGYAINATNECQFIMNLDAYGSMCASNTPGTRWKDHKMPFVFSGTLGYGSEVLARTEAGQFSLGSTSENYEVMTRLLYDVKENTNGDTINLSGETFTGLDGNALAKSDKNLALDAADLNKYYLYQDANGDVRVDYLVDKSKSIPEPTM